jgi:4-amino-4-deoxychorismate lyase
MSDEAANVVEGTATNLFIVKNQTLYTSDLTHAGVAGVMRAQVLERAAGNVPCVVKPLTRADVLSADEIFLTNSLAGVWPVVQLENQAYAVGVLTQRIQAWVKDSVAHD